MITVRLEQWAICASSDVTPYTPPECIKRVLTGLVYGHPRFPDGSSVRTSELVELNLDWMWGQTCNTRYELGECDPEYAMYVLTQ